MSYTTLRGFGISLSAPVAPPSAAALCNDKGGVKSYTEEGFTFKVGCQNGASCSGGAEQEPVCSAGGLKLTGSGAAAQSQCPEQTSWGYFDPAHGPPGVIKRNSPAYLVCRPPPGDEKIAEVCNRGFDPGSCFYAVRYNQSWKNRSTAAEVAAWRAWYQGQIAPPTSPPPDPGAKPNRGLLTGINVVPLPAPPPPTQTGTPDPGAPPPPPKSNTMLYVGLGVGALVLIGGAVWYMNKDKAKAAA